MVDMHGRTSISGVLQGHLYLLAFLLLFKNGLDIKLAYYKAGQEVFQHTSPPQSSELYGPNFWQHQDCLMPTHFTLLQLANHFVISSALACKDSLASLFCISWFGHLMSFVLLLRRQ